MSEEDEVEGRLCEGGSPGGDRWRLLSEEGKMCGAGSVQAG